MYGLLVPALVAVFSAFTYGPGIYETWSRTGFTHTTVNTVHDPANLVVIQDTTHCEDLHYHASTNSIFTACEDVSVTRHSWFPGLGLLKDPLIGQEGKGSIHVIDTKTHTSKRLSFENFDGTFITHGIDVLPDPERSEEAMYVFAVNHVPNPDFVAAIKNNAKDAGGFPVKARSQIEIFHHVLGSSSIRHVRSIVHPLIKTPNDIHAESLSSIYVTNDHYYREGRLRMLELVYPRATWSDVAHVQVKDITAAPTGGIQVDVALTGLHNNNGLGHGRSGEVLITSCASGTLYIAGSSASEDSRLQVKDSIPFGFFIDNPSYFDDPYKTDEYDASSYILPGITKPFQDITSYMKDASANVSSAVWQVKRKECTASEKATSSDCWVKRKLFEDDGGRLSSASGAVLVPIDPKSEGGQRKAWLFVSGFVSRNAIAVKVDI